MKTFHWISVKDKLPVDGSPVLVCSPKNDNSILFWNAESSEKMHDDFKRLGFSHWMQVDEPE